jgi:hypothetical protein
MKRRTKSQLTLLSKLNELANSQDPAIAVQAVTRLADLELQQSRAESKVGPLREELAMLRKKLLAANDSLRAVTSERDQLAAKVAEWQPQIERLPAVEEELAALNKSLDSTKDAMRAELLTQAAAERTAAERSLWKAQNIHAEAQAKFDRDALSHSVKEWQRRIADQSMPDFWDAASRKHSALFWESWPSFSDVPNKAGVWVVLANRYLIPDSEFKKFAMDVLISSGPQYATDQPVTVEHLEAKRSFVLAAAEHWGIREELEGVADDEKLRRYAAWMEHAADMRQAADARAQRLGYGREELLPASEGAGYNGPHLDGCCCRRCNGVPPHLQPFEF